MAKIINEAQARHHARAQINATTLVVSETGDIHVDADVDDVVARHEKEKKKYFILKGEKKKVKKTAE